jgi:hypothetical protein
VTNNKIQVIYRLTNRITLMWPSRPNDSNSTQPQSFNVYWDTSSSGAFTALIANVPNISYARDSFGVRSYANKVVLNITPTQISGWNNDITNYVRLTAVINGIEQTAEAVINIEPYTSNGIMRLHYPELQTRAIIGFNKDENRFIPVSVDTNGKVITTT